MYEAYTILVWPLLVAIGCLAIYKANWALLRCVVVTGAAEITIGVWADYFSPKVWEGQPSHWFLAIYIVSVIALTIRPSGKLCSIMAGISIWGVVLSALHFSFHWTKETDALYFQSNLFLGWLTLIVIAGGSTGERGRRFILGIMRGASRMANPAHNAGLA